VLENEVTELKSRLAEAERRASVVPAVSTTEGLSAAKGKRESLLPAPIFPLAAEAEGGGVGGRSEALLRNALAEKYDALAPSSWPCAMQRKAEPVVARAKGVSLGGLETGKPPPSSAAAGPRRRVTVGSCEPQYMDGSGARILTGQGAAGDGAAPAGDERGRRRESKGRQSSGLGARIPGVGEDEGVQGGRLLLAGSAVVACAAVGVLLAAQHSRPHGLVGGVWGKVLETSMPYVKAAEERGLGVLSRAVLLITSLVNSKVEVHLA
jgi:hypothetical protein